MVTKGAAHFDTTAHPTAGLCRVRCPLCYISDITSSLDYLVLYRAILLCFEDELRLRNGVYNQTSSIRCRSATSQMDKSNVHDSYPCYSCQSLMGITNSPFLVHVFPKVRPAAHAALVCSLHVMARLYRILSHAAQWELFSDYF